MEKAEARMKLMLSLELEFEVLRLCDGDEKARTFESIKRILHQLRTLSDEDKKERKLEYLNQLFRELWESREKDEEARRLQSIEKPTTHLDRGKAVVSDEVDIHNSGTSNNGANMRAISMLRRNNSGTSNNGANMRAISMLRRNNSGTSREIELASSSSTLNISATSDDEKYVDTCLSDYEEYVVVSREEMKIQGFDQYIRPPPDHSKFQTLFNVGMSVPVYFSSWGQELKCWASSKSTEITGVLYSLSRNRGTAGFLLPSYRQDLGRNTPVTLKDFLCYVRDSFLNMPPRYRMALIGLCCSYAISEMKNTTAPFENFQLEITTNAPPQPLLLTFLEAFSKFNGEIFLMATLMLCFILYVVLSFAMPPAVQILLFMVIFILPAFSFVPGLAHKASKTGVVCGSIKLPAFWVTVLGSVGLLVLLGLLALGLFFILWMRSDGNPGGEAGDDASLNGFAEALQE